jgi:hypothetical protein
MDEVTIFVDGMELRGKPQDLARVLAQMRGPARPAPVLNGHPGATAPTPLNPQAAWPFPQPKQQRGQSKGTAQSNRDIEDALNFLQAIDASDLLGDLDGEAIAQVLHLKHPKGIGSRAAMINKTLESLGFKPSDVYTTQRNNVGVRHWKAGPRLAQAIEMIKKGGGGTS